MSCLTAKYDDRAVWFNGSTGELGAVPNFNGTIDRPCCRAEDAVAIATALNLTRIRVLLGDFELTEDINRLVFLGDGNSHTNVRFEGHAANNCGFWNLNVGGDNEGTTGLSRFYNCRMRVGKFTKMECHNSGFVGTMQFVEANAPYRWQKCYDAEWRKVSPTSPAVSFNNPTEETTFHNLDWNGRLRFTEMNANSHVNITGRGLLTIDDSCTGGTITKHGDFTVVDNSGGLVTVV